MPPVRARKHRLPDSAYQGRRTVSFTACEVRRRNEFACDEVADAFVAALEQSAIEQRCIIPAYCIMPDHLHVVIKGLGPESRPKMAMERFKWLTGSWFAKNRTDLGWQEDFYDRVLRAGEWANHVRYVLLNPCRAGLAEDIGAWPYSGSLLCDLDDVIWEAFQ